ncbi:MAG TPA: FMN-binding negative transcriptional regulator [Bryobacteraceae bacterium]|jgi:transcriptional regulator
MYIPPTFRVDDAARLAAFVRRYSFATVVTFDGGAPFASHVPMLYHPDAGPHGTLVSHMARGNPQWQHFTAGGEALVIFQGPHGYISPTWYRTEPAVPTWNYAVVHAYGTPAIFTEHERIVTLLRETVATYEASLEKPWSGELPEDYRDKMIRGIVAFEIPVARLEGKFKLNQNRAAEDIEGVIEALLRSDDPDNQELARLMAEESNATG